MSSRNPFGDTSRGSTDDRNATTSSGGRDSTGGTSDRAGDDRNETTSSGGRDRDRDDDDRGDDRNQTRGSRFDPFGDPPGAREQAGDDRNQTSTPTVSTDLPRTPDDVGGAEFRNDTVARNVAEQIGETGGQVGRAIASTALDARGAGAGPDRQVVEQVGESIGRAPGDVAELGVDVAQATTSVTGTGAREGPVAAGEQARDIAADAADAGLGATDALLDIDDSRRQRGEGATVQVEDANRQEAAVTATVSALTLAGGSAAGTATGLGLRGLPDRVDGTSPDATAGRFAEFAGDTRAQGQVPDGRRGGDGSDTGGSPTQIDPDDISPRPAEPDQGPAAFPDPEGRFEGGGGFSRGSPDRGDAEVDPAAVEPSDTSGGGGSLGFRSVSREAETAQVTPRADSPLGTDLRAETDFSDPVGLDVDTRTGAAAGLGSVAAVNDPTGIAPGSTATGTGTQPGVGAETGTGALGDVAPVNDQSGVSPQAGAVGTGELEREIETIRAATGLNARTDTDTRLDTRTDTRLDAQTRLDTRTESRLDTEARTRTESELRTATETRLRTDTNTRLRTEIEDIDIPGFGATDEEADPFGFLSSDRTFGSGIQSAEEAVDDAGLGGRTDDPFSL
jgi:hypothetical protein